MEKALTSKFLVIFSIEFFFYIKDLRRFNWFPIMRPKTNSDKVSSFAIDVIVHLKKIHNMN